MTHLQQAIAWYAKNAGGAPSTYLHRPAIEFSDGTAIVFRPVAASDPKSRAVVEVEIGSPLPEGGETNGKPQHITDPWGVKVALRPTAGAGGLAGVTLQAKDPSLFDKAIEALSGSFGPLPISVEESPADATPATAKIGFRAGDLEGIVEHLVEAGATEIHGPARFVDVHVIEATITPGLRAQIAAEPPQKPE